MDKTLAMRQVAETGRLLLSRELVARTWGNFSAKLDADSFCITPSGLGYEAMTEADTVCCRISDLSYTGSRKPSSEKGIHAAAYRRFADIGFVIHTHQTFATALGLTEPGQLRITPEEAERLGGVAWAEYGLPGTKKLCGAVSDAMQGGAHTVLMAHHGALICGADRDDAIARAELLEAVCRRSCLGQETAPEPPVSPSLRFSDKYPTAALEASEPVRAWAALRLPLPAQLDDMAQMMGTVIPVAKTETDALRLLRTQPSVLLPGVGAVVRGEDADDSAALCLLTRKAAVAALHCRALGVSGRLSLPDCVLMRAVYKMKYSKQKKG